MAPELEFRKVGFIFIVNCIQMRIALSVQIS